MGQNWMFDHKKDHTTDQSNGSDSFQHHMRAVQLAVDPQVLYDIPDEEQCAQRLNEDEACKDRCTPLFRFRRPRPKFHSNSLPIGMFFRPVTIDRARLTPERQLSKATPAICRTTEKISQAKIAS